MPIDGGFSERGRVVRLEQYGISGECEGVTKVGGECVSGHGGLFNGACREVIQWGGVP